MPRFAINYSEFPNALNKNTSLQVISGLADGPNQDKMHCPYTDDLTVSWLGWVQTPQYFEHCYELKVRISAEYLIGMEFLRDTRG